MNYFIVNNGFHLDDALALIGDERPELIVIPHLMNRELPETKFSNVYHFKTPIRDVSKVWLYTIKYFEIINVIRNTIHPKLGDVLFIYTEYEILNQFIAKQFKSQGCKVVLLEEGIATLLISHQLNEGRNAFTLFNEFWVRNVFGLRSCSYARMNNIDFPLMSDSLFDAFGQYTGCNSIRDICSYPIRHAANVQSEIFDFDFSSIVFLNEPIYDNYVGFDEYLDLLKSILQDFTKNFKHVYFKFHPRETETRRDSIRLALSNINVSILETNVSAESICLEMKPSHVASFMSAALLKIMKFGIQPIFLHHLMPSKNAIVKQVDALLNSLNISNRIVPSKILPNEMTCCISEQSRLGYLEFLNEFKSNKGCS